MRGRVRDWRTRLLAWAATQVGRPFRWGETDCATLARAALAECFGEDVAPNVPRWHTKKGAAAALREHDPIHVLESLGAAKMTVGFARAGDIVQLIAEEDTLGGVALGVWIDGSCLITSRKAGVQIIPAAAMPRDSVVYSLWEIQENG